jgi:hypothetical protein
MHRDIHFVTQNGGGQKRCLCPAGVHSRDQPARQCEQLMAAALTHVSVCSAGDSLRVQRDALACRKRELLLELEQLETTLVLAIAAVASASTPTPHRAVAALGHGWPHTAQMSVSNTRQ